MKNKNSLKVAFAILGGAFIFFVLLINRMTNQVQAASYAVSNAPVQVQTQVPALTVAAAPISPVSVSVVSQAIFPTTLEIPSINVNAPVKALGLTADGKMDVPNNFTDIGWYSPGTKPGDIGSAVMGAHVDNGSIAPTIPGVFKNLSSLSVGSDLYVSDSNGKVLHFKVTQKKVYNYNDTDTQEVFGSTGMPMLNLITCYGTWLPAQHTYDQRLVIFSELVSS